MSKRGWKGCPNKFCNAGNITKQRCAHLGSTKGKGVVRVGKGTIEVWCVYVDQCNMPIISCRVVGCLMAHAGGEGGATDQTFGLAF